MTVEEKAREWTNRRADIGEHEEWTAEDVELAYIAGYKAANKLEEIDIPTTNLSEAVGDEATQAYGLDFQERPDHYRKFGFEVWKMMQEQFGDVLFYAHLQMAALEYQMRVGHKEGQTESDLRKIKTLFAKMAEIKHDTPDIQELVKNQTQ